MAEGREASPYFFHWRIPVARAGFIFILPLLGVTVFLWLARSPEWASLFTLLTGFVICFFRDPERAIPPGDKAVLSPADGKIIRIEPCLESPLLKGPAIKVSIFMSIFNVHVNRIPLSGCLVDARYRPGKFFSANLDKASAANEQNALLLESPAGVRIVFVQIAGLIARRIVCWVKKGETVERGRRFGLIRFGSRLDVFLPPDTQIQARLGQRAYGGQTVLGFLP